jgi:hypothetical protein
MDIMITIGIAISWYPNYIIRKNVAMDLPKISAQDYCANVYVYPVEECFAIRGM